VWFNKGIALAELDKLDEALKCFEKAIEIDPKDARAWSNKGIALDSLGKADEALKSFNKAKKLLTSAK
jgi:Flp pilus assembly protein TadD